MKKSSTKKTCTHCRIGLLIILALLVAAFYISYRVLQLEKATSEKNIITSSPASSLIYPYTSSNVSEQNQADNNGLTIYTNKTHNYIISVPSEWIINDKKGVFLGIPGEIILTPKSEMTNQNPVTRLHLAITVMQNERVRYPLYSQEQFDEWFTKPSTNEKQERLYRIGDMFIDGKETVLFVIRTLPGDQTEAYFSMIAWTRNNDKNYYFEIGGTDVDKVTSLSSEFFQILKTVKFL